LVWLCDIENWQGISRAKTVASLFRSGRLFPEEQTLDHNALGGHKIQIALVILQLRRVACRACEAVSGFRFDLNLEDPAA
jgi:hypothetical protein